MSYFKFVFVYLLIHMNRSEVVDWMSLLFGLGCYMVWISVYLQITNELVAEIAKLPKRDFDEAVRQKGSYLTLNELEQMMKVDDIALVLNGIMTAGRPSYIMIYVL